MPGWLTIAILSVRVARVALPIIGAAVVLLVKRIHGDPASTPDAAAILVGAAGFAYHGWRVERRAAETAKTAVRAYRYAIGPRPTPVHVAPPDDRKRRLDSAWPAAGPVD